MESDEPEETECLVADTKVRFDFLTFNIDENSTDLQKTNKGHLRYISSTLKAYDGDGEEVWLQGFALKAACARWRQKYIGITIHGMQI